MFRREMTNLEEILFKPYKRLAWLDLPRGIKAQLDDAAGPNTKDLLKILGIIKISNTSYHCSVFVNVDGVWTLPNPGIVIKVERFR